MNTQSNEERKGEVEQADEWKNKFKTAFIFPEISPIIGNAGQHCAFVQ